jgi:hypothetical protein
MRVYVVTLWALLRARFEPLRREPEAGYSTETVLVTALLVVLALGAIALVAAAVITKAGGIKL